MRVVAERGLPGFATSISAVPSAPTTVARALVRDDRLDHATARIDAQHVRRRHAVDDRRAEPEARVDDPLVLGPRARVGRAVNITPPTWPRRHPLEHHRHPHVTHAVRGEIRQRAPRRNRRPHGANRLPERHASAHPEPRLGQPRHRHERPVLARRARPNREPPRRPDSMRAHSSASSSSSPRGNGAPRSSSRASAARAYPPARSPPGGATAARTPAAARERRRERIGRQHHASGTGNEPRTSQASPAAFPPITRIVRPTLSRDGFKRDEPGHDVGNLAQLRASTRSCHRRVDRARSAVERVVVRAGNVGEVVRDACAEEGT